MHLLQGHGPEIWKAQSSECMYIFESREGLTLGTNSRWEINTYSVPDSAAFVVFHLQVSGCEMVVGPRKRDNVGDR